jgi:hypothetical protein
MWERSAPGCLLSGVRRLAELASDNTNRDLGHSISREFQSDSALQLPTGVKRVDRSESEADSE